ncbi:efflux RND transporter periplasmic adaptor subunit [Erythrobacter sp. NE805]|uniref:efflux RND transporter periplasmic adaptor subunit n=1 Tax=Erythrobacter sp. NE805 TaxID=3389875 RepID=UPI00396B2AFA
MTLRAGALFGALLLLAGCNSGAQVREETLQDQARAVRVAAVTTRLLEVPISASGRLVPREEAAVGAELAGYRVAQVLAEEGDVVRRGAVLARLDPALIEGEIARARAEVARADATAARTRLEAERVKGLDGSGVLSQEAIDQRRIAQRESDAALASARAQLRDLTTRRARLTLRAPVGGTIIARSIAPGSISGAGTDPLFRIARDSLIELAAEVTEADLARIRRGAKVDVTLPDGSLVAGEVRTIQPRIEEANQLGIVRVRLPVREDLRAGGTATARFAGAARNVLAVPEAAIQYGAQGPSVMVLAAGNRAQRVAVRTGTRAGGYVELLAGPKPGTQVLLSGAAFVLEGDIVRPVKDTPAKGAPRP